MKKIRKEIEVKDSGGIFDLVDNVIKLAYNITDDEYDFICERATEEEIGVLIMDNVTFSDRRKAIEIRNKYLKIYEVEKEK